MPINERMNVDGDNKLGGVALILASTPQIVVVWSLIVVSVFGVVALIWLRDYLTLIGTILLWSSIIAIIVKIAHKAYVTYHVVSKQSLDRQTLKEKLEKLRIQNETERAKLSLTYKMAYAVDAGIANGRNISYSAKGELQISDWRSNVHSISEIATNQTTPQIEAPLRRISITECVEAIEHNSLKVCVGSIQDTDQKAIITFKKSHFKFIGASQKGKSSLVATFLDVVSQTHSADVVQFAILDMEDMTGNLFSDLPHVIKHARSKETVVLGLREMVSIMDYRYTLPVKEIAKMPIILIYVEEFLDLKNQLKAFNPDLYKETIAHITTLATRGLKARCQLMLCAQTEYRDSGGELAGALANIPNGFSVCLKPEAARAAGFTNTVLLNKNYQENKVGVFVAKHPQLQCIVVGAECDLEKRLADLEQDESDEEEEGLYLLPQQQSEQETIAELPKFREKGPQADAIDINEAIGYWNDGYGSENKLMAAYPGLTKYQANKLYKRIKAVNDRLIVQC